MGPRRDGILRNLQVRCADTGEVSLYPSFALTVALRHTVLTAEDRASLQAAVKELVSPILPR